MTSTSAPNSAQNFAANTQKEHKSKGNGTFWTLMPRNLVQNSVFLPSTKLLEIQHRGNGSMTSGAGVNNSEDDTKNDSTSQPSQYPCGCYFICNCSGLQELVEKEGVNEVEKTGSHSHIHSHTHHQSHSHSHSHESLSSENPSKSTLFSISERNQTQTNSLTDGSGFMTKTFQIQDDSSLYNPDKRYIVQGLPLKNLCGPPTVGYSRNISFEEDNYFSTNSSKRPKRPKTKGVKGIQNTQNHHSRYSHGNSDYNNNHQHSLSAMGSIEDDIDIEPQPDTDASKLKPIPAKRKFRNALQDAMGRRANTSGVSGATLDGVGVDVDTDTDIDAGGFFVPKDKRTTPVSNRMKLSLQLGLLEAMDEKLIQTFQKDIENVQLQPQLQKDIENVQNPLDILHHFFSASKVARRSSSNNEKYTNSPTLSGNIIDNFGSKWVDFAMEDFQKNMYLDSLALRGSKVGSNRIDSTSGEDDEDERRSKSGDISVIPTNSIARLHQWILLDPVPTMANIPTMEDYYRSLSQEKWDKLVLSRSKSKPSIPTIPSPFALSNELLLDPSVQYTLTNSSSPRPQNYREISSRSRNSGQEVSKYSLSQPTASSSTVSLAAQLPRSVQIEDVEISIPIYRPLERTMAYPSISSHSIQNHHDRNTSKNSKSTNSTHYLAAATDLTDQKRRNSDQDHRSVADSSSSEPFYIIEKVCFHYF